MADFDHAELCTESRSRGAREGGTEGGGERERETKSERERDRERERERVSERESEREGERLITKKTALLFKTHPKAANPQRCKGVLAGTFDDRDLANRNHNNLNPPPAWRPVALLATCRLSGEGCGFSVWGFRLIPRVRAPSNKRKIEPRTHNSYAVCLLQLVGVEDAQPEHRVRIAPFRGFNNPTRI